MRISTPDYNEIKNGQIICVKGSPHGDRTPDPMSLDFLCPSEKLEKAFLGRLQKITVGSVETVPAIFLMPVEVVLYVYQ